MTGVGGGRNGVLTAPPRERRKSVADKALPRLVNCERHLNSELDQKGEMWEPEPEPGRLRNKGGFWSVTGQRRKREAN